MELKLCPFCGLQYCKHQALFPFNIVEWNNRPIEDNLQSSLTEAININTEMQREIEKLRANNEKENGMYIQTCVLANNQMAETIKKLRKHILELISKEIQDETDDKEVN
jgi:hypothetical protein